MVGLDDGVDEDADAAAVGGGPKVGGGVVPGLLVWPLRQLVDASQSFRSQCDGLCGELVAGDLDPADAVGGQRREVRSLSRLRRAETDAGRR